MEEDFYLERVGKKAPIAKVHPIDRIPMIKLDESRWEEILQEIKNEKHNIDTSRSEWYEQKLEYLNQWDNFVDYKHAPIIEGQPYIHIPLIQEKIQAWHARMYKNITGIDPMFTMRPLNAITFNEMEATKLVLEWYLRDEINMGDGLKPFLDELLWDLGSDGWAVGYKHWIKIQRRIIDIEKNINVAQLTDETQEAASDIRRRGRPRKHSSEYKEIPKIINIFSGVLVETLPHECVYFPEYIPTSGDMNHPRVLILEFSKTKEDYETAKATGFYDKDAVDESLKTGRGYWDWRKQELKRERERLSGVETNQFTEEKDRLVTDVVFYRGDLDEDGVPEEYVFTLNLKSGQWLRKTYLDRICRDHNRPAYKFDLMKRPRSAYSRGFPQTLYGLNQEVDDFHNIRRAAGLISNVPWGFYRATSGLEKEAIEVAPGKFFPVDDPQKDVREMNFKNNTSYHFQEEALAQQYADKLVSMPSYLSGSISGPVGPLRSNSGLQALLQESQAPLDVYLDRFRIPFGKMINGVLADLRVRLPKEIMVKVLGESGEPVFSDNGEMKQVPVNKEQILNGKYKFDLAANDAQFNPEKEAQDAIGLGQMLLTQLAVGSGIVSPMNQYKLYKKILIKRGWKDWAEYITKPEDINQPLTLYREYATITAGQMPMIVMNDKHEEKINGLIALLDTPEFAEGLEKKTIHQMAPQIAMQVLKLHQFYQQQLQSLPAMPNQSGMEVPLTMGARSAGVLTEGQVGGGTGEINEQGTNPGAP